jgi:hypothetical protein
MQAVQMLVRQLHELAFMFGTTALAQTCGPSLTVVFQYHDERFWLRQRCHFAIDAPRRCAVPLYNRLQYPHCASPPAAFAIKSLIPPRLIMT